MMLEIICSLNPNKSHGGRDNISIHMIKICSSQIVFPLKLIDDTCVDTGLYPDFWKMSNICPIHKMNLKT